MHLSTHASCIGSEYSNLKTADYGGSTWPAVVDLPIVLHSHGVVPHTSAETLSLAQELILRTKKWRRNLGSEGPPESLGLTNVLQSKSQFKPKVKIVSTATSLCDVSKMRMWWAWITRCRSAWVQAKLSASTSYHIQYVPVYPIMLPCYLCIQYLCTQSLFMFLQICACTTFLHEPQPKLEQYLRQLVDRWPINSYTCAITVYSKSAISQNHEQHILTDSTCQNSCNGHSFASRCRTQPLGDPSQGTNPSYFLG